MFKVGDAVIVRGNDRYAEGWQCDMDKYIGMKDTITYISRSGNWVGLSNVPDWYLRKEWLDMYIKEEPDEYIEALDIFSML